MSGDLGKGWRKNDGAVVIGPLALLYPGGYANAPRRSFVRPGGGYFTQKVLAVVRRGAVVTVSIAGPQTRTASLLYDPARFEQTRYEVSDGERAVTFQACAAGEGFTQFNGGFVVAGPRCVPLEVSVGNGARPMYTVLSFGAGGCARYTPQVTMADAKGCPVTLPRPFRPPAGVSPDALFGSGSSYGNGKLWVGGLWPKGVIVATPELIERDGSVGMKFGWWRQVSGPLSITGRWLDGPAPPLRADVPSGYGTTGFQASGVRFPTEGCWELTVKVGTNTLTFVTFVIKRVG